MSKHTLDDPEETGGRGKRARPTLEGDDAIIEPRSVNDILKEILGEVPTRTELQAIDTTSPEFTTVPEPVSSDFLYRAAVEAKRQSDLVDKATRSTPVDEHAMPPPPPRLKPKAPRGAGATRSDLERAMPPPTPVDTSSSSGKRKRAPLTVADIAADWGFDNEEHVAAAAAAAAQQSEAEAHGEFLFAQAAKFAQESADAHHPDKRRRQPNHLSADSFFQHVMRGDIEREGERLVRTRVHAKWEHAQMADASRLECRGAKRIRLMKEALEELAGHGFPWSMQQRIMFMAWLSISYPSYYGDELNAHLYQLLREMSTSELRTECLVEAPRRNGKTIAVSGFAACELITQSGPPGSERGHDVLVYSNNMRASKMVLLQTYKMVKLLIPRFGGRIKALNKNESMTVITSEGFENEIFAFPAKPDNLRGTGSKAPTGTVIAEEFAYMDVRVVFQIIGPTLTRKNVKFIGITTVNPNDSFVTPLIDAKFPDGRSVFLTLNFELICSDCKKAGKANECRCLMADIPEWQSSNQHDKLSLIMSNQTFMAEIKGLAIDETITPAFHQVCVFVLSPTIA